MDVYDATMMPVAHPIPGMKPIDVLYQADITDGPSTLNLVASKITPDPVPGTRTLVDLESARPNNGGNQWHVAAYFSDADLAASCALFSSAADTIRAAGRTNIGFFGVLPICSEGSLCLGPGGVYYPQWLHANTQMAPLLAHVNALYPACYVPSADTTFEQWMQMTQLQISAAKLLKTNQIFLMLRPTYWDESGPLPSWYWTKILQFCRRMASINMIAGVVIWDNPQRPFIAGLQ